ncbi:MAG: hypothetical protein KDA57_22905 [Planctomycetales bacterium]|nr:hypothetical protein [Planctomycetales bacterium]
MIRFLRLRQVLNRVQIALFAAMLMLAAPVTAWNTVDMTPLEFDALPRLCKSAPHLPIPRERRRLPASGSERTLIWDVGAWHYCTGVVKVRRAELMPRNSPDQKDLVNDALVDIGYSFERMPKQELWYAEMAVTAARCYRLLGNTERARRLLDLGRKHHPDYAPTYSALALLSFDEKDYATAIGVLEKGNEATGKKSSELNYFLGLAYFYAGDIEKARHQEALARELGYPLSGLARKIAQHGRSTGSKN